MSRVDDIGKVMGRHLAIQTESCVGAYSPQRNCSGPCRKRKSITQFSGANTACDQCVRRTPQPTPATGDLSAVLRVLIADDAYAATFQTLAQYRTALLKHLANFSEIPNISGKS